MIELDQIADAARSWENTLLLHTFQAEMVYSSSSVTSGTKLGLIPASMSAMVDLRPNSRTGFSETFFVVLAERSETGGVMMHMWQLELSSSGEEGRRGSTSPEGQTSSRVTVSTSKVCTAALPLPVGVEVVHCVPAAGHLSSSSIYPACLAPYLLTTACSDNTVRFWCATQPSRGVDFEWFEWKMEGSDDGESRIQVPGAPVSVSAAYSGRLAVAYKAGHAFHRKSEAADASYVNLAVAIYECESTGGGEWVLEDRIMLKNVEVPKVELALDKTIFQSQEKKDAAMARIQSKLYEPSKHESEGQWGRKVAGGMAKVPSIATVSRLKEGPLDCPGKEGLVQKRLVQLDWVSNEDGSHILTVSVADKVMLLTTVSSEIAQANMAEARDARKTVAGPKRPLLRRSSSIGLPAVVDE